MNRGNPLNMLAYVIVILILIVVLFTFLRTLLEML